MKSALMAVAIAALMGGFVIAPVTQQFAQAQVYAVLKSNTGTPSAGDLILVGHGGGGFGGHMGGGSGGHMGGFGGHMGGGAGAAATWAAIWAATGLAVEVEAEAVPGLPMAATGTAILIGTTATGMATLIGTMPIGTATTTTGL